MTKRINHAFTKKAFNSRTPTWANNMVGITVLLTTVATFIIASDTSIAPETAVRIGVYLKALDLFIAGLSKMFGVTIEKQ
jgi:hypothetical protein